MNSKPKNTVVLKMANLSNPFETLYAKIWVMVKIEIEKISSISYEKYPVAEVRMINQNVNPAVTAIDLKRGDENCNFKSDKWMLLGLIGITWLRRLMQVIKSKLETYRIYVDWRIIQKFLW